MALRAAVSMLIDKLDKLDTDDFYSQMKLAGVEHESVYKLLQLLEVGLDGSCARLKMKP